MTEEMFFPANLHLNNMFQALAFPYIPTSSREEGISSWGFRSVGKGHQVKMSAHI